MKAIRLKQYGSPEVLEIIDTDKPKYGKKDVLVKIHSTSVSTADVRIRSLNVPTGFKFLVRLMFGLFKPKKKFLGMEFSGVVESCGELVTEFEKGDHVYGTTNFGAYAEYLVIKEREAIIKKPDSIILTEASGISFGALTSYCFLQPVIKKGSRVLINAASGSLGVAGIMIAKHFGAHVTGICSAKNISFVKSFGADDVIDYTSTHLSDVNQTFDIIYDVLGNLDMDICLERLTENGHLLLAVAGIPSMLKCKWKSFTTNKTVTTGSIKFTKETLLILRDLYKAKTLTPVIDRVYQMNEIIDAHTYVDSGRKKGNVIVKIT